MKIDAKRFKLGQVGDGFSRTLPAESIQRPEQQDIETLLVGKGQNLAQPCPLCCILTPRSNIGNGIDDLRALSGSVISQLGNLVLGVLILR